MQLFDTKLKDYIKDYNAKKNIDSGGGGGAGAFTEVPEPYKPINLDEFLKAPSTEEMNQKQDVLLTFEKDYKEITLAIDTNYELYKEYTKQLDDLEKEMEIAPETMDFSLNQKYNQLRDAHNILVEKLQGDTKKQKEIYEEYTKVRTTYDKDIEIYNRWAEAQNKKEPKTQPKEVHEEPTWGQVVYHTLRAGLSSANKNFWNIGRMLEMGKIAAEDKIDDFFFPGAKDRQKRFEEKYGKDPDNAPLLNALTGLMEDAEKIEAESAPQAESANWLKQSVNIGLRPVPQIAMSVAMGAAVPTATGIAATKTTAEFMTNLYRMLPFGSLAGAGKAREIEKQHIALEEEAPYMKMLIGGTLAGLGEMATEMPVFLGVMKVLGKTGAGSLINKGAKTVVGKYGKIAWQSLSNILVQGVQEGEMFFAGKAIDQALGDPQDWSKEELIEGAGRDFYGGLCMGFMMLGIGGGAGGSVAIAQKSKRAFDRFVKNEDELQTTLRKMLEYQGIIMEEAEIEALAYRIEEEEGKEKVEPKPFEGEAWRAETGTTRKETAKEIIDFEAEELGNKKVKIDAEKVAKDLGIKLEEVRGKDVIWVTKTKKEAEKYGEAEKVEIKKPNIILATDPDGGFLVLQNTDKYIKAPKVTPKTEPKLSSDKIRSEYIKKAEESAKRPTRDELLKVDDLVIVRKEGEKYTYSEQWIESCWKALFVKTEYKGLNRADAIEKFVGERFSIVADINNLKIDNWDYIQGRLTVEMTPKVILKTPVEIKAKEKRSLEGKLKESQKEINRLKGIIKTIKGNKEKRQAFKKELVKYIKENMPYAIQNKMLATVKNVSGDKALEKAMEKVDQYVVEHYTRQYIKTVTKELKAKRIKPKRTKSGMLKGKFIPIVQDKLDFIRANINGSRAEALNKIQENIALFNQGKAINIAEENELLNMVGIKEMDLETLQSTLANIKKLKKVGRTLREVQEDAKRAKHEEDIIDTLEVTTGKEVEIDEETGKGKIDSSYKTMPKTKKWGLARKAIDKIINWQFGWDNLLDKLSVLDKTSKPYESKLSKIGDKVHYARSENIKSLENVLNMIQMKFAEAFEITHRKQVTKICQKLREEVDLGEFKNSEGDKVHFVLTKEQILKKVMQLDDPSLEPTFKEGMFYTEEIEKAFRDSVTKKEQAWIDGVREVYDYMWERVNPIFEEMYGIHFPYNPFYSGTIRRDVNLDIPEASLMAQDAFRFASILNPSLKARSKTKQSLKYDDMTSSLMNYVMQMEHFINWAKPLQELRSVFGDKRVKSVINEVYGEDILNKVNGFLDDMTRDGVDKAKIIKAVDTIRFNFTRSILAKPHIALKQIPSFFAYMTEMPIVDFFEGVGNFWKNPIKNYRYLIEHSAYARARFGEGFERDIHGAMQSDYVHLLSHTHKFSDIFMGMVRAGDKFAVMQGMWAKFYSETKGQTIKAKNAEEAMRRAEITTQRTQPSFTIESLATGQRGGSFLKLFTMFQNQPNKYFRIIADNARNFKYGRGSRMKAASNIVLAWAILPMIFQFIGDGGKWIKEHQLRALILGAVNDLLVFGAMIRGMYGWLIKEAYDVQASPVFSTMREIEYCLAKIAKWNDPTKDITPKDIQAFTEHFAKGLGQLVGLPTPYGVQVKKAIQSGDYRQLLFSEYILKLGTEKEKKKKPYVKSYSGDKYGKYLKSGYTKKSKYGKYLKY